MQNREILVPGTLMRHFKGMIYQIIAVAKHSETREDYVVYQALYGDYKTFIRPLDMFLSEVDHEKYPEVEQKYRFEVYKPEVKEYAAKENIILADEVSLDQQKVEQHIEEQHSTLQAEEVMNTTHKALLEFLDARSYKDKLVIYICKLSHIFSV